MYTLLLVALSCLLQTNEMDWKQQTLTVAEAQALTSINDLLPDDALEAPITHFECTIKNAETQNEMMIISNTGEDFNEKIKAALQDISPGSRIWFDNIRQSLRGGKTRIFNLSIQVS